MSERLAIFVINRPGVRSCVFSFSFTPYQLWALIQSLPTESWGFACYTGLRKLLSFLQNVFDEQMKFTCVSREILYSNVNDYQGCKLGYNSHVKSHQTGFSKPPWESGVRCSGCAVLGEKGCSNPLVMSALGQGEGTRGACVTSKLSVPKKKKKKKVKY